MSICNVERIHSYSPLRYPGGKTGLLGFFRTLIRASQLRDVTYVEPFAGGAGAALGLLISGQVSKIVINDLDPAISAFWKAVVFHGPEFSTLLENVQLSVEEWHRQRLIYKTAAENDTLKLGFSTFFLNRTSHSGVLNAGPIGGISQSGTYKIDARFNRDSLLERIRLINLFKNRIQVSSEDGVSIVGKYANIPNSLIYADPPYFAKGSSLYLNSFRDDDHQSLADCLNANANGRWVLTYDDVPQVEQLYFHRHRIKYSLHYSVHTSRKALEAMIFSDTLAPHVPEGI